MEMEAAPVLIAYDGSDYAKAAVEEAGRQLAPARRAIVLTVGEGMESFPFLGVGGVPVDPVSVEGVIEAAREGAAAIATEGARLARAAGFEAEAVTATGAPTWQRIVEAADEHGAGLIVIGSQGRTGISRAVLGSVAAAVAQHSSGSVLIVHRR